MPNMKWSELSRLQLGQYGEYYAMMEFASYGCDVYTSQVDDHGVDFVAKINGKFYEVQVKSVRGNGPANILRKHMDVNDEFRLVCYLNFSDETLPSIYIIPAIAWKSLNKVLKYHERDDYWAISYSENKKELLAAYEAVEFFSKLQQGEPS